MLEKQQSLPLSQFPNLYDIVVSKDHILRKWKELVDFNFIYEELQDKYCLDNGRKAECPIRLFKYLLIKCHFNESDKDLVERSQTDMAVSIF